MSSAVSPSQRGHCIQVTDNIYYCRCLSFALHASPLQDPSSCATCGHNIYTHVGYPPGLVHRPLVSPYATYILERTPTTQDRTQLAGNVTAVLNPRRSIVLNQHLQEPFKAGSQPEQGPPPHTNITRPSGPSGDMVAPVIPITSRRPTILDPYHPTDWMYRMTLFTGSESVSKFASAPSSSEAIPLYAPRATHPHPNINLSPAYTQTDASYSLDDGTQHQAHSDSFYGIQQTNAFAEDDVIVHSDDEAHESSY